MVKRKQGTTLIVMAVLMLSLVFSGLANAAGIKTIKKGGMELFNLRQAAEMYGYSIEWNAKEKSVSLAYMGKMDDMMMEDDKMMKDDMMASDDKMMKDDTKMEDNMMKDDTKMEDNMMKDDMMMEDDMMKDDMMMESAMKPAGEMIKLWIGSKKVEVDGMEIMLDMAPTISKGSTYVVESLINQYMMPAKAMK